MSFWVQEEVGISVRPIRHRHPHRSQHPHSRSRPDHRTRTSRTHHRQRRSRCSLLSACNAPQSTMGTYGLRETWPQNRLANVVRSWADCLGIQASLTISKIALLRMKVAEQSITFIVEAIMHSAGIFMHITKSKRIRIGGAFILGTQMWIFLQHIGCRVELKIHIC